MQILPPKIAMSLKRLQAEHIHYVAVKLIKRHYYAFEVTGKWDKERKKRITLTGYLGRIKEDGTFIPASHRRESELQQNVVPQFSEQKVDKYEETILRNLSMNARIPIPILAERLGLSITATGYQIKKAEEKYGIRYILDIDLEKLAYMQFILFIKFSSDVPPIKDLKQIVEEEPHIQFAVTTKGDYDIFAYLIEEDTYQAEKTLWKLRQDPRLNDYDSIWHMVPLFKTYGTSMLRNKFFEDILKTIVLSRSKEVTQPKQNRLKQREFMVLKKMNDNSSMDFTDIDAENNLSNGASQYAYHKLLNDGIIVRPTISIHNLPVKYIGLILIEYVNITDFNKTQPMLLSEIITDLKVSNKYALVGDIESPTGVVLFLPILSDKEFTQTVENFRTNLKGVKISTFIATDILVGSLCYRKFDNTYSTQHEKLVKANLVENREKITYYKPENSKRTSRLQHQI